MKIWITGASGLVGQAVQKRCIQSHLSFTSTSHADVDIGSPAEVRKFFNSQEKITHLINCAAFTRVDDAEKNYEKAFAANTLGPENLGKLAHQEGIKVLHLSTDYVFNSDRSLPLKETDPCLPCNVYAKTKREGELRLLEASSHACIVRTSWVFGPGGKNLISSLWERLHLEKAISVSSDQINRLTYVDDLAKVLLTLLDHEGIFHFANHGLASRYDVALYMRELLEKRGQKLACQEILPALNSSFQTAALRPRYSALETQKIENLLGISPRNWQIALKEHLDAL